MNATVSSELGAASAEPSKLPRGPMRKGFGFAVEVADPGGPRAAQLTTPHGTVKTPLFMPVGTLASVKGVDVGRLAETGADPWVLATVISAEYLGVGLGTAASVAFIARETSRTAVATQFALFTAIAALPRVLTSSVSGLVVDSIGWTDYFYVCAVLALPGLALLHWVAPWRATPDVQPTGTGG